MPSHVIPLLALAKKLDRDRFECWFMVNQQLHGLVEATGFRCVEIDRRSPENIDLELRALREVMPDVIIDDLSLTTAITSRIVGKPRISIVRTGTLPYEKKIEGYEHSSRLEIIFEEMKGKELDLLAEWKPKNTSDLFLADMHIVPSIPSIESLPSELRGDESYVYSGSLHLSDEEVSYSVKEVPEFSVLPYDTIDDFIRQNRHRKIVFFTYGFARPSEISRRSRQCIKAILNNGASVITNIPYEVDESEKAFLLKGDFFPLSQICSQVDAVVHQCGNGMYNFQILNELPGIVLGTKRYDRDQIARQLERLGAAVYLPADDEDDHFHREFDKSIRVLLEDSSSLWHRQRNVLRELKNELELTSNNFNLERVIEQSIERSERKRRSG